MKRQVAIAVLLVACQTAFAETAGRVASVRFDTLVAPPVFHVPPSLKKNEALFRAGLEALPEGLLVVGALAVGGSELSLSASETASLTPLVTEAYARIAADPAFTGVPSALPYCFSRTRPTSGHYFLYRPDTLPENPTCIVFLHGYGGNFQFYTWVLKEEFPDAVILSPSWGVSWHRGSAVYLEDMLSDARRRLGVPLKTPWLMGISAGGRGGFLIYNQKPDAFAGYVSLASAPETATARTLQSGLRILMLNGTADPRFPIAGSRRQADLARRRVPTLQFREIEGDHFFLLRNRKDTFAAIREFMSDGQSEADR